MTRTRLGRQFAQGLKAARQHPDVGIMFICWLMHIHDLRAATRKNSPQIGGDSCVVGSLHVGARVRELNLNRVAPKLGRMALFIAPHCLHLFIGKG